MENQATKLLRVNIDQPKFDMSTYIGRAKHFILLTNPLNIFASDARLQRAREVVTAYRNGLEVPYVKTMDEVWHEKYLYDSAFHPETGEKMFVLGRMAAQVPLNTFTTTCLIAFYKTRLEVLFFQWLNQSCNAFVNYTNRSGKSQPKIKDLLIPYFSAVFGALATAFSLKYATQTKPVIVQRFVPFAAVAAANFVNLPLMRQNELRNGIRLIDSTDCEVGFSRKAAAIGISQVVFSRICITLPSMIFPPIVVERLENKGFFEKYPKWNIPIQAALVGFILIFSTPLGCAFFPQKKSMKVEDLETNLRERLEKKCPNLKVVYYNKGL